MGRTSTALRVPATTEVRPRSESRDMEMQDAEARSPRPPTAGCPLSSNDASSIPVTARPDEDAGHATSRDQVRRSPDVRTQQPDSTSLVPLTSRANPFRSTTPVPMQSSTPTGVNFSSNAAAVLQAPNVPGPTYTCDLCKKPIKSKVWSSCRICGDVDLHKKCVLEGRRIHHQTYPKHGFMQVARDGEEEEEDELIGGLAPTQPANEEKPGEYGCNECRRPMIGMRHFCISCPDLEFCDDHFIAGMKKHQMTSPEHVFGHKHVANSQFVQSGSAEAGAIAGASSRGDRARRSDTPMDGNSPAEEAPARSIGFPPGFDHDRNPFTTDLVERGNLPTFLAEQYQLEPDQARSQNGPASPTPRLQSRQQSHAISTAVSTRASRSRRASAPIPPSSPPRRPTASHSTLLAEQFAKGIPSRPAQQQRYPPARASKEAFAEKWLFHFHSHIRTWSKDAGVAHTSNGMQMLVDFNADATLNEYIPAHYPDITGVFNVSHGQDHRFVNPFHAAAKVRQLNQFSIENWRLFRDRDGMIDGQVVATMGSAQLQAVDALLQMARELGRIGRRRR